MKPRLIVVPKNAKTVILVDDETGKLIFFTRTFSPKIEPGEYTSPGEILQILSHLSSKGHGDPVFSDRQAETILRVASETLSSVPLSKRADLFLSYIRSMRRVMEGPQWR